MSKKEVAKIVYLRDPKNNDSIILPKTHESAVVDSDGVNLESKLSHLDPTSIENITYSALKTAKDTDKLVPGKSYRITDYVATVNNSEARSANHPFDIIVTALTENELSEDCGAALHDGDTYFAGCDFDSWKISYCIDNDSTRFDWAVSNGKGVVFRMIDEWGNDLPYDFKGIQFKRYKVSPVEEYATKLSDLNGKYIGQKDNLVRGIVSDLSDSIWCYSFSNFATSLTEASDGSLLGHSHCNNNRVSGHYVNDILTLNNVVFGFGDAVISWFTTLDQNHDMEPIISEVDLGTDSHSITFIGEINDFTGECFNAAIIGEWESNHDMAGVNECLVFAKRHIQDNEFGNFYRNIIACRAIIGNEFVGSIRDNVIIAGNQIYGCSFSDMQNNTIIADSNINHSMIHHGNNNTIVTAKSIYEFVVNSASGNTINCGDSILSLVARYRMNNNTITLSGMIGDVCLGANFINNTITGTTIRYVSVHSGFVRDSTFTSLSGCGFYGKNRYITIPDSNNRLFIDCDIVSICGKENNNTVIDYDGCYTEFDSERYSTPTHRTRLTQDDNGNLTARWIDGSRNIGAIKLFGGSSWSSISDETTSNKVNTITSSSTNVQYPSALAVYNLVQNNTQIEYLRYTSNDIVSPSPQDFDGLFQDTLDALDAGRLPIVVLSSNNNELHDYYYLRSDLSASDGEIHYVHGGPCYGITLIAYGGPEPVEIIKTTSGQISSSSTSSEIPTSSAVYDFVSKWIPKIDSMVINSVEYSKAIDFAPRGSDKTVTIHAQSGYTRYTGIQCSNVDSYSITGTADNLQIVLHNVKGPVVITGEFLA